MVFPLIHQPIESTTLMERSFYTKAFIGSGLDQNKDPAPGSPAHVFVQKGKHIRLPNAHAEKGKGVPVVGRLPDWRVDLQQMRFTELLQPRVQRLARRDRVVVRGMNEEYRHLDVRHGTEEARAQLGRPVPAVAGTGEDYDRPQVRFP